MKVVFVLMAVLNINLDLIVSGKLFLFIAVSSSIIILGLD